MVRIKIRGILIYWLMLSSLSWEDNLVVFREWGLILINLNWEGCMRSLEFWKRLSACLKTEENQEKLCRGGCEQDNDTALHIHTPQHPTRYGFTTEYWCFISQNSWRCFRLQLSCMSLACWQYIQRVSWYVKCTPWGGRQRLLCANCGCKTVYYCVMLCWFPQVNSHTVGPGGRTVYGVGLQPLARIVGAHPAESTNRVCVAHSSSVCEGLTARKEEYYRVCGSNCVLCRNLKKRRTRPDLG